MASIEDLITCLVGADNVDDLIGTPGYVDNLDGTYSPGGTDDINTSAGSNPYAPAIATDWPIPAPANVAAALDCLAEKTCLTGLAATFGSVDGFDTPYAVGDTAVNVSLTVTNPSKFPAMLSLEFVFRNTTFSLPLNNSGTLVAYNIDFGGGSYSVQNLVGTDNHGGTNGQGVIDNTSTHQINFSGYSQSYPVCLDPGESITVRSRKTISSIGENGAIAIGTGTSLIRWSLQN